MAVTKEEKKERRGKKSVSQPEGIKKRRRARKREHFP